MPTHPHNRKPKHNTTSPQHEIETTQSDIPALSIFQKIEKFWIRYQQLLMVIIIAVVVIGGGWLGYNKYVLQPKELKAADAIAQTQRYFAVDSFNLVLNGDGRNRGALYVIKTYGGTKAGNLARFYAGVSYLHLQDFKNAAKYLEDFSTTSPQVQQRAYACLADAYSELGKNEKALEYYKKAGDYFPEDEGNSAQYLFRAGLFAETLGKTNDAIKLYEQIKTNFPNTALANEVDKYIYHLSVQKNNFSIH